MGGVKAEGARAFMFVVLMFLIVSVGGAGAMAAGEPAEDGVDTAGDAMLMRRSKVRVGELMGGNDCIEQGSLRITHQLS